ncbi:MAG: hypothetical protein VKO64_11340 [Candidatus Sericytochromatia bacterium]|nr:hypothetical protein [Candidatus Sericytochromatia bacterium]
MLRPCTLRHVGLLAMVACAAGPGDGTMPLPADAHDPVSEASQPSPTGIFDTTVPFVADTASNLYLLLPRRAECLRISGTGSGIGNPVLGPPPENFIFHDRDGRILAWDMLAARNILIEGEPGRNLSGVSVSTDGKRLAFHGPDQLCLWHRVPRPDHGPWPLRGRTTRLPTVAAWAAPGGGLAEAWGDAEIRTILVRNRRGEVALVDIEDGRIRTMRTGDLGPIRSCSMSPSGRRLLLESARGLHAYEPETRKLDALPEIDRVLGGPNAILGSWQTEDGFLAHKYTPSGRSRHIIGLWPTGRVLSAWAMDDFSELR